MTRDDDIYSLLQWCIDKELEAHIAPNRSSCSMCPYDKKCDDITGGVGCIAPAYEDAFHEMVEKIQNMRVGQRPHVVEQDERGM